MPKVPATSTNLTLSPTLGVAGKFIVTLELALLVSTNTLSPEVVVNPVSVCDLVIQAFPPPLNADPA